MVKTMNQPDGFSINHNIRVVMVHTPHPGNIGAVARVMKNMCLDALYLVKPRIFPSDEANARSSGALDVLENAVVCDSLAEALADCQMVIGTSARQREVNWEVLSPAAGADKLVKASHRGPVALLLGRESSGLTNDELDLCHYLVHIPANPEYSSLNVAMAAQILSYETLLSRLRRQDDQSQEVEERLPLAQMENFFEHLYQTLMDIEFMDERRSDKLMRRLKRLFHRAAPTADEMNILRGILSAAQGGKSMRK